MSKLPSISELTTLPRWAMTAIASRAALRAFPIVGNDSSFHHFGPRINLLFGADLAIRSTIAAAITSGKKPSFELLLLSEEFAEAAAGKLAPNDPPGGSVYAAISASRASRTAHKSIERRFSTVTAAESAIRTGSLALEGLQDHAIRIDFEVLEQIFQNLSYDDEVPWSFFETPVWPNGEVPEPIQGMYSNFIMACNSINLPLFYPNQEFSSTHDRILEGLNIGIDDITIPVTLWPKEKNIYDRLSYESNLESGQSIVGDSGVYELIEYIGKGGVGYVWKAKNKETEELVAIKVLHEERFQLNEGMIARFFREAELGSQLKHINLVRVLDRSPERVKPAFIVMNYVDGIPLSKKIGKLDEETVVSVALQILEAVDAIHRQGLLHRDLKTNNIILSDNNNAVVCDYGLIKRSDDTDNITEPGDRLGSVLYISEHQVSHPSQTDIKDDIHSMIACFFELFSGKRMSPRWSTVDISFLPENLQKVIRGVLGHEPEWPRDKWPNIDELRDMLQSI